MKATTLLEKGGIVSRNLSGGQQKLLELGRSMMSGATMILMDEPIAGFTPAHNAVTFENEIRALESQLSQNKDLAENYIKQRDSSHSPNEHSLEIEINELNQRQRETESRVAVLERKANMSASEDQVKSLVNRIFLKTPAIENIYTRTTESGFVLIIVHNMSDIADAFDQIQPGLAELEDELPDTYFEHWYLHLDEVEDRHLRQSNLIFKR